MFGSLSQAIDELSIPRMKTTRPVPSFKGLLTLGNVEQYDSAMAIDVERYPRVMVQRPPTASSFVIRSDMGPTQTMDEPATQDLAAVKNARTYQIADEDAPGGKRDVEQEELAKGYSYGSTAVPISESDSNVTTFETMTGLDVIGFVTREQVINKCTIRVCTKLTVSQYERYMDISRSNAIIAQRTNDKANLALSSFIHALYEVDSYAVARLVPKDNKAPTVVILAPSIEPDHECLYEVELPFAEDVRSYRFPALDKVLTISGKELKQHRNLPEDPLLEAMSQYVDAMDLSKLGADDEGQPAEYMPIEETFSPVLHRVNQVIRQRAVHPSEPLPPIPEILLKYSNPPPSATQAAQPALEKVLLAADVKKVPPKARSRRTRRDAPKPLSGLDVTALLSSKDNAHRTRISPQNAIPEFKQLLEASADAGDEAAIEDACGQLAVIIKDYIRHSVGSSGYGRATEAIRVMREECVELEQIGVFNAFLRGLKGEIMDEVLDGDRREMWFEIRRHRLGLIQAKESGGSGISDEEAKEFLSFRR